MLVEVCANSLESAMNAEKAGADRIELCSELAVGGVTPSHGLIKMVVQHVSIPVHVLIRPRSGDFTYSEPEFDSMIWDIDICRELGVAGIVSGILQKNFELDEVRTSQLIATSKNLYFTFHRAFDWIKDPFVTVKSLERLGADCVLTSGQEKSAIEGLPRLKRLKDSASKLLIMPGSGINENNVDCFREGGFGAVHLSGIKMHQTLNDPPAVSMNTESLLQDDKIAISDLKVIQAVVNKVK